MRKSTLFISVTLTTFALVILSGVVAAYQAIAKNTASSSVTTEPIVASTEVPATEPVTLLPAQSVPQSITPEQAADIAAKVLGRTDLFSAELSTYNNTPAYLITFINSDIVYVGLDGQVLSISQSPVFVTTSGGGNNGDNNRNSNGDDDHEENEHEEPEHEGGDD